MVLYAENVEVEMAIIGKVLRVLLEFAIEKKMNFETITYRWDTKSVNLSWETDIERNINCFLTDGYGNYKLVFEINAWKDSGDTRIWRTEMLDSLPIESSQELSEKTLKDLKSKLNKAHQVVCSWEISDLTKASKLQPRDYKLD